MRPLLLELTGFRSYDRARVDWSRHDLVVIGGATGAGKTSLLDAIAFALFGRTSETARTGELLRLGAEHGEVRLEFGLHDERWRITRRFGPGAPDPAHMLERLAPDTSEVVTGEGPPDWATMAFLGLGMLSSLPGRDPALCVIRPGRHVASAPDPVRVEKLAARTVDPLIGVRTKVVALCLEQVRRQPFVTVTVIIGKSA